MDIEEYKKAIRELMESGSTEPISNSMPAHAAALYELFFQKAKYEVDIFCENLSKTVFDFDWVRNAFRKALTRGVAVRLLIQNKSDHHDELLRDIAKSGEQLLQIRYANVAVKELKFNFSVMDNQAYRYEPDKQECVAVAQLNDSKNCKTLNDVFATLWQQSAA